MTFVSRGRLEDKQARACGWEKLPTRDGEREHFEHSIEWARQIFERTTQALDARTMRKTERNASNVRNGRLFVVPDSLAVASLPEGFLPNEIVPAQEHVVTSDLKRALSSGATAFPKSQILSDWNEGRFLASAECDGKWFGVSKVVLTMCTRRGNDALITDVPGPVVELLRVAYPGVVVVLGGYGEGGGNGVN